MDAKLVKAEELGYFPFLKGSLHKIFINNKEKNNSTLGK